MARVLNDSEISALFAEPKLLPESWQSRLKVKPKSNRAHSERELDVKGRDGHAFRVILRRNDLNRFDFSVILCFVDEDGEIYRLCRFNGRHPSEHTNKYEKARKLPNAGFRNRFHIHRATERYQLEGYELDGYAEVTEEYDSYDRALEKFFEANNFVRPASPDSDQMSMFEAHGEAAA